MKRLIKYLTYFGIAIIFVLSLSVFANAEDTTDKTGSITINYSHDGCALENIEFKVYRITELNQNNCHILLSKYQDVEFDEDLLYDSNYWIELSEDVENCIDCEHIEPEQTFCTDEFGSYKLSDLDLGIYFVQAENTKIDDETFVSEPILLPVGHYDDDEGKWIYDYQLKPKITVFENDVYNLSVKKVWKNTNSELLIPKEIQIELLRNGEKYEVVTLSKQNNWLYILADVNPADTWAIKELGDLKDFKVSYEKDVLNFTVTNTYVGAEDGELPQTGSFAHLIPMFLGVGVILVLVGVLLKHKNRCE